MNTALKRLAGVAVTAVLLIVFVRLFNVPDVVQRLEHLDAPLALLCGAAFLGAYVVRSIRWRCFLAADRPSLRHLTPIYFIATMVNWLLPVQGGELVKCGLLAKLTRVPASRAIPSVAADKLMDLLPAVVLLAALPFLPLQVVPLFWTLLVALTAVVLASVIVLGLAAWRRDAALGLIARLTAMLPVGRRAQGALEPMLDACVALAARPSVVAKAAALTAAAALLDGMFCWLAFQAIGAQLPFAAALCGYTMFNLAFILPTLPGQVGSNELIGLLVFSGILHVDRSAVAAMFLFSHPWTALLIVASGTASLWSVGGSFRSLSDFVRGAPAAAPAQAARPATVAERPEAPSSEYAAAALRMPSESAT